MHPTTSTHRHPQSAAASPNNAKGQNSCKSANMLQAAPHKVKVPHLRLCANLAFVRSKKELISPWSTSTPIITVTDTDNMTRTVEHASAIEETRISLVANNMVDLWIHGIGGRKVDSRKTMDHLRWKRKVIEVQVEILGGILEKEEKKASDKERREKRHAKMKQGLKGMFGIKA